MKRSITLLLMLPLMMVAHSQCEFNIPADAQVLMTSPATSVTGSDQNYWVCSFTLHGFTGSNNTIYIEPNSQVAIGGDYNIVYYRGTNTLSVSGDYNIIYIQEPSEFTSSGLDNLTVSCPPNSLSFNYANAPAQGCPLVSIEEYSGVDFEVSPNPVEDILMIRSGSHAVNEVRIHDLQGRIVSSHAGAQILSINTSLLEPATYIVRISTEKGSGTRRFIKQ